MDAILALGTLDLSTFLPVFRHFCFCCILQILLSIRIMKIIDDDSSDIKFATGAKEIEMVEWK